MYLLNKKECLLLASGYDAKLRLAIINRWEELELAQQPKIPQSFAEALMLAAQQAQQIEEQQKMLEESNEEKEELQVCLNESLKYYTVAKYNKEYKCKWNMTKCKIVGKALSRYCRLNSIVVKKCKTNDERFGDVNSYPLTAFVSMMENNKF